MYELFVGGGSTSVTSVLLRCRYPLTVRGYLFALLVGGLAVAGPCPTSTMSRSYPREPGRSLSATCDPFGSLQLGASDNIIKIGRLYHKGTIRKFVGK